MFRIKHVFSRSATHFNISMFGHQIMFDDVWWPNIFSKHLKSPREHRCRLEFAEIAIRLLGRAGRAYTRAKRAICFQCVIDSLRIAVTVARPSFMHSLLPEPEIYKQLQNLSLPLTSYGPAIAV